MSSSRPVSVGKQDSGMFSPQKSVYKRFFAKREHKGVSSQKVTVKAQPSVCVVAPDTSDMTSSMVDTATPGILYFAEGVHQTWPSGLGLGTTKSNPGHQQRVGLSKTGTMSMHKLPEPEQQAGTGLPSFLPPPPELRACTRRSRRAWL